MRGKPWMVELVMSALPRGLGLGRASSRALAGLRARGRACLVPTGRRFPRLSGSVLERDARAARPADGGRSHSPLRGSSGVAPDSLLRRSAWFHVKPRRANQRPARILAAAAGCQPGLASAAQSRALAADHPDLAVVPDQELSTWT